MKKLPSQPDLVERLLVLTLSLADSIRRDDWVEADCLFKIRRKLVDEVNACTQFSAPDKALLVRVRETEEQILAQLRSRQSEIATELSKGFVQKKAAGAYAASVRFKLPAA